MYRSLAQITVQVWIVSTHLHVIQENLQTKNVFFDAYISRPPLHNVSPFKTQDLTHLNKLLHLWVTKNHLSDQVWIGHHALHHGIVHHLPQHVWVGHQLLRHLLKVS